METDAQLALTCSSLNEANIRAWLTTLNTRRTTPIDSTVQRLDEDENGAVATHHIALAWPLRGGACRKLDVDVQQKSGPI